MDEGKRAYGHGINVNDSSTVPLDPSRHMSFAKVANGHSREHACFLLIHGPNHDDHNVNCLIRIALQPKSWRML